MIQIRDAIPRQTDAGLYPKIRASSNPSGSDDSLDTSTASQASHLHEPPVSRTQGHGLTPFQRRICESISDDPGIIPSQLEVLLKSPKDTVRINLNKLVAKGVIKFWQLGRMKHFYPESMNLDADGRFRILYRDEQVEKIIDLLRTSTNTLTINLISRTLNVTHRSVKQIAHILAKYEFIRMEHEGNRIRLSVTPELETCLERVAPDEKNLHSPDERWGQEGLPWP